MPERRTLGTQPTHLSEIRVLIADERKLFRQGLMSLFTTELGLLIIGDTGDGLEAVRLAEEKKPDVLVVNVELPGLDGISIGRRLCKVIGGPGLVFLSNHHIEARMREAFLAGARAYLLQNCDFKELVFAIRKVALGDYYLTGPAGREMVFEYVQAGGAEVGTDALLTRRELELSRLLADGYSTKEAAARLGISVKTADVHRSSVMKKLNAKNVTDIVKYCIRNNIIKP